ncbi:MAG: MBL fold metallo-hydrolase [Myxococcales bacterium]|jgi:N-acyl homoserine lactone hydrolase
MRDLFFLSCGGLRAPRGLVFPEPVWTPSTARLSLTVAVCVRDDGSLLLVDAGWSEAVCEDPVGQLGWARAKSMGLELRPEDAISIQLAELGFEPGQVKTIVATHLHFDHVTGVADFPNAEIVTTPDELQAFSGLSRDIGYRARDLTMTERIRVVRMRQGARYGFSSSLDLFGDDEVVLLEADGHTPGHVAVALRGPQGLFIHVGDAVYNEWELAPDADRSLLAKLFCADKAAMMRTRARLRACRDDEAKPVLVPSHDSRVFESLAHRPATARAAG